MDPYRKELDAVDREFMRELVHNSVSFRRQVFDKLLDPRRNIDEECGFPADVTATQWWNFYCTDAPTARIIELFSKEMWRSPPSIFEHERSKITSPFEVTLSETSKRLRGEQSWFSGDVGDPLMEYFQRLDLACGISSYAVMVYGINDGLDLSQPAKGIIEQGSLPIKKLEKDEDGNYIVNALPAPTQYRLTTNVGGQTAGRRTLEWVGVFPEAFAQVVQYESNRASPRFGRPLMYLVQQTDPRISEFSIGAPTFSQMVHWTRVVHACDTYETFSTNDCFSDSRGRSVLKQLYSLMKLLGASAEGYWKNCFAGLSLETHPNLGSDVDFDIEGMKRMVENFQGGLQRALFLIGMTAKTIAPQVVDPSPYIASQWETMAIKKAVPIRILKGSERGEQASTQDDDNWSDRLMGRMNGFGTPRICVPGIDRLIHLGCVDPPKKTYNVEWKDPTSMSAQAKATLGVTRIQGLAAYVGGNLQNIMAPEDAYTELGFTEEEAKARLDAAEAAMPEPPPVTEEPVEQDAVANIGNGCNQYGCPGDVVTKVNGIIDWHTMSEDDVTALKDAIRTLKKSDLKQIGAKSVKEAIAQLEDRRGVALRNDF